MTAQAELLQQIPAKESGGEVQATPEAILDSETQQQLDATLNEIFGGVSGEVPEQQILQEGKATEVIDALARLEAFDTAGEPQDVSKTEAATTSGESAIEQEGEAVESQAPETEIQFMAETLPELYEQIDSALGSTGVLKGTQKEYTAAELKQLIAEVHDDPSRIREITRAGGLRSQVRRILRTELALEGKEIPGALKTESELAQESNQPVEGSGKEQEPSNQELLTPEQQRIADAIKSRDEIKVALGEIDSDDAREYLHDIDAGELTSAHVEAVRDVFRIEVANIQAAIAEKKRSIELINLDISEASVPATAENTMAGKSPEERAKLHKENIAREKQINALRQKREKIETEIADLEQRISKLNQLINDAGAIEVLRNMDPQEVAKVEELLVEEEMQKAQGEKTGEELTEAQQEATEGVEQTQREKLFAEAKNIENFTLDELKAERARAETMIRITEGSIALMKMTVKALEMASSSVDDEAKVGLEKGIERINAGIDLLTEIVEEAKDYLDVVNGEINRRENALKEGEKKLDIPAALNEMVDRYPGLMDILEQRVQEGRKPQTFLEWLSLIFESFLAQSSKED